MKVGPIITEIRLYCPIFEGRVAGAAEFRPLPEDVALDLPAAYVIPEPDSAGPATPCTAYYQEISDEFTVVVVLPNPDKRGQAAWDQSHDARAELWRALVGWPPGGDYSLCRYTGGGEVIAMDRARLYVAFGFAVDYALGHDDTRQGADLDALPTIDTIHIDVDVIDPAYDPNLAEIGPDGRIEVETQFDTTTE